MISSTWRPLWAGFEHPCGYWHSHDTISGGTTYDWGGHYLDWVVSLIPDRVTSVIGTRQDRVWHDVTNADQERIQIRFAGGQEADFIHSDIAAVRKPKWYLLGTEGAIIGHWRDVTAYETDPVLYYHRHDIPATEMPAGLDALPAPPHRPGVCSGIGSAQAGALSVPPQSGRSLAHRGAPGRASRRFDAGGGHSGGRQEIRNERRHAGVAGCLKRSGGALWAMPILPGSA